MSLDDSDKPVEHYEHPYIVSKLASASLIGHLSPPTRVSPIARLPQACITHETQFFI